MRKISFSLVLLALLNTYLSGQNYKVRYAQHLEDHSKVISGGYNYTVEKMAKDQYIFKKYHPERNVLNFFITYDSKKLKTRHGLYYDKYDDGSLVNRGYYNDGVKTGFWIENTSYEGEYQDGKRIGKWVHNFDSSRITTEMNYVNGMLHGPKIYFDSLGIEKYRQIFEMDSLISSTKVVENFDSTEIERMPFFRDCPDSDLKGRELKSCRDKEMLYYIYKNIKYPKFARQKDIQGSALLQFIVDKTGSIEEPKFLRGVCKAIEDECLRLILNMDGWSPGIKRNTPVRVQFVLPIRFKLE